VLRPLAWVAGLIALVAFALQLLLHSLDRPWLKRRLLALVRTSAGVEVDYRTARADLLSGAVIEGLVVQSPADVRLSAPDLVRVGRVEARWSPRSLLWGRGPLIERAAVSDVTLTVVVDEHGNTSFDALSRSDPTPEPGPGTPLSAQASRLLAKAPPVGRLEVDHVTLVLVRTEHGEVSEHTSLSGLALTLGTSPAAPAAPGWRVDVGLGSPAAPLELNLSRSRAGSEAATARASAWLAVAASSNAMTAALDLRMLDQTFAASVSADHWLHVEAGARFVPAAKMTEVTLDSIEVGDGSATAQASIEVPDAGAPIVHHAHGDIDIARLLQWLPAGLVPVRAERARVHWQVASLVAGSTPTLSTDGSLTVEAVLSNVVVSAPAGPLQVAEGELSLTALPAEGGGMTGRGAVKLAGVRLASGENRVVGDDVALDLDGKLGTDHAVAGRVGVRFAHLELGGALPVVARDGHVELRVRDLRPDVEELTATRGDVSLSAELASLDARRPGMRATADGLALRAHTTFVGHAPYGAELETNVSRLHLVGRDDEVLADAPARIEAKTRDVQPDLARPAASRGMLTLTVALGEAQASLDAKKGGDAIDFGLRATTPSLKIVRPFLPPDEIERAPWDRMAATLQSSGHVDGFGGTAPSVRQTTEIHVERPAYASISAQSLSLTVKSQGTALRHQADVDLLLPGLAFDGGPPSDDHVKLSATLDRERPSVQLTLATEGRAATHLAGSLSFDRSRRAVLYDVDGHLAGLRPLAPFAAKVQGLDAFDLSELEVGLSARGALFGVVAGVASDGTIELEPTPARTAAVEGKADLRVAHFRWARGDTAIITPALTWHGDMHVSGPRRTLDSRAEIGTLHVDLGRHDIDLNGVEDQESASLTGDLANPEIQLAHHLSIGAVAQDVVPEYPLGDVTFALSAQRSADGVVHVGEAKLANGLGGTALTVTGNADLGDGRRTLSVTTSLTQDLARLSKIPERFEGRGKVAVQANVSSPDLARYAVRALVKGENVTVALPRHGVELDTANGEVPFTVALEVGDKGVQLERTEKRSPYSMLRFADQHPLLAHSGFLSIARLKTPFVSIAPLVGNLEIEQNVVSLRQFEMGVRGGTITGQCGLDWDGPKSTLELHVRASGVQSSHGEPFDGNISVIVSAADRTIEGRAEILRIGERHLLDLLDLQDPLHVDPGINRIRRALDFGYPDSLRLVFDHGFASAHLQLGGLASLVSIGDLRGIPMGPIVDKMIAPMLEGSDTKEGP
jgi:hypothetical protein